MKWLVGFAVGVVVGAVAAALRQESADAVDAAVAEDRAHRALHHAYYDATGK